MTSKTERSDGLYHDVSWAEYCGWPALSQSLINIGLQRSMLHMQAAKEGRMPSTSTPANRFGSALHCYLLEGPQAFDSRYQVAEACSAILKTGKRKGEPCGNTAEWLSTDGWVCGVHAGADAKQVTDAVTEEQFYRIRAMARSLSRNDVIRIWRSRSWSEASLLCSLEWMGCPELRGKARIDRLLASDPQYICDVKTTADGTEEGVRRSIRKFGYDVQAAWYVDLYRCITGWAPAYIWIFGETEEPYDVHVVRATAAMLRLGRAKYTSTVMRWRECCEHQCWPGYAVGVNEVDPAEWELRRWGIG